MRKVAERLRKLRIEAGYSEQEVATAIDVCLATYKKYEKGQGRIRTSQLVKLALLYNKSCDYIACMDLRDLRNLTASKRLS